MSYQPVLIVLKPELDPPLPHQFLFVRLFQAAPTHIVTQLIEIIRSFQNSGIHFPDIAQDMGGRIERIDPYGTFLQVEPGKFPDILLHPRILVRRQQNVENGRTESTVLEFGVQYPAPEIGGIDTRQLAEISRVDIPDLGRSDHQIVHDRIVENRSSLSVIDDPACRVDAFAVQRILFRLLFVFFGNDLQMEQLRRHDQEHPRKDEADDIATGLIEYRHIRSYWS